MFVSDLFHWCLHGSGFEGLQRYSYSSAEELFWFL